MFDIIVLLQPTSPLRDFNDIDRALDSMMRLNSTSVISVYKYDNKILKTFIENSNGFLESVSNENYPFTRRQDLPLVYMSNGAIYIVCVKNFFSKGLLFTHKCLAYHMSLESSIDIDNEEDLKRVELILSRKGSIRAR